MPEGKLLKIVRGRGWSERVVSLEDPPEWMTIKLAPTPIAEQLRKPHPVVKRLRDDSEHLRLPRSTRGRALRLLNALALTASECGHEVRTTERPKGYVHHRERDDSSLTVVIKGHDFGVEVTEVYKRVPHVPTEQERRKAERDSWYRIPKNDDVATGVVKLSVDRGSPHRQSSWTDADESRAGRMLAEILQEIELRAHAAEEVRLKRERVAEERRQHWQSAMDEAKDRLQEAHRAAALRSQLEAWELSERLGSYRDQVAVRIDTLSGAERSAAEAWLAWMTKHIAELDPLSAPIQVPPPVEATAENLKPHLGSWGYYGPDYSGRF